MPPVLVDLFCNDLEVAKSVTVSEVGPTSAYVEHPSPLPVGAALRLHTDEGTNVAAVVVRVHEALADSRGAAKDSAGSERQPGMFVRVLDIAGDVESWWKKHLDHDVDPVFPERAVPGSTLPLSSARTNTVDISAEELARMAAEDRTEASAAVPIPGPPPADDSAPNAAATSVKDLADASASGGSSAAGGANGAGGAPADVNTTVKMTADQVRSITDQAPAEARNGTSMGMAVAVPPPEIVAVSDSSDSDSDTDPGDGGKKKRRRRKKKKS